MFAASAIMNELIWRDSAGEVFDEDTEIEADSAAAQVLCRQLADDLAGLRGTPTSAGDESLDVEPEQLREISALIDYVRRGSD